MLSDRRLKLKENNTDEAAKKDLKNDQIKMSDIKQDSTPGKKQTHSLLKTMPVKHPRVFHDTRLYTNKDIELQERKQSSFGRQVGGTNK